jgi:hypothetical protein
VGFYPTCGVYVCTQYVCTQYVCTQYVCTQYVCTQYACLLPDFVLSTSKEIYKTDATNIRNPKTGRLWAALVCKAVEIDTSTRIRLQLREPRYVYRETDL